MAHISSLYLFAKETDAVETVKGFKFQELKTLEAWLSNKINAVDEEIYCDFEEDIFQRDLNLFKATFKQLKLYSSKNFSFSSEEIIKALSHFFMLFVKKEYLMDDAIFIFETNTSIAAKREDNDAELLREWFINQDAMSADLLARCVIKLKAILSDYVESQYAKLVKDGKNKEAEEAKSLFENLPDTVWEAFAKSIKWVFTSTESDEAIACTIKNIQSLISKLPFPITREEQDTVFDKLRGIVSDKSMATNPEDRRLTNDLLVQTLLNMGAKDDKNYIMAFHQWKDTDIIDVFRFGEFYEALYMAKHCRRNAYLHEHSEIWLRILEGYYNYEGTPEAQKREIVYELVWLTLKPLPLKKPSNSLAGLEQPVRNYFGTLEQFDDISGLEDCLNLLSIIASAEKFGLIKIEEAEIVVWHDSFKAFVERLRKATSNKDYYVSLLEIESFLILNFNAFGYGDEKKNMEILQAHFDDIIKSLPDAKMFSVSQLGGRLDDILELYFKMDVDAEEESIIEAFSEKLLPFVKARDSDMATAKSYVIKGAGYLDSNKPKGLLKALSFFQKAKELYYNTDAKEGYVLALLNISQFYSAIGMNMIAKYYSLSAIWYCINSQDTSLYKRISDGYSHLFHCDFKQGSWISALQNFESYIGLRGELHPDGFDPSTDVQLRKSLFEVAYILAISPLISTQLSAFIEYEKTQMGSLYSDLIIDYVEEIKRLMDDENLPIERILKGKVDNPPINDIGGQRVLSWKIFGSTWEVFFENSFIMNSIGEEFAALIQVFLVDIAINDIDLLLLRGEVKIYIELSDRPKAPEQIEDNLTYSWKVYLTKIDVKDSQAINMHYAYISTSLKMILSELSLLPEQKFEELFTQMLSKGATKNALVLNAYQIMYRKIFSDEKFTSSMRQNFSSEYYQIFRFEIEPLQWKDGNNKMYDSDEALAAIQRRYTRMERKIHLTLERIMNEADFQAKVITLRSEGWLDWQILMALMNHIVNLKAYNIIRVEQKTYVSEEEKRKDFHRIFEELMQHKDEDESYVEIPLEYIIDSGLDDHIRNGPGYALESYGLESKSRFPNLIAIRKFISEKFNYDKDDVQGLSPFNF